MQVNERRIHQVFEVSVLLKGLHAVIECIGGVLLYLVSTATFISLKSKSLFAPVQAV